MRSRSMNRLLLLTLAFAGSAALAQESKLPPGAPVLAASGSSGKGGQNAVVCFDDSKTKEEVQRRILDGQPQITDDDLKHVTSVDSYDYYDARTTQIADADGNAVPAVLDRPGEDENWKDWFARLERTWEHFVPRIAELIERGKLAFEENIGFKLRGVFYVGDTEPISGFDADHCLLATIANQRVSRTRLSEFTQLDLDGRLFGGGGFDLQSSVSRKFTFLHEAIYNWSLRQGKFESRDAREILRVAVTRNLGMTAQRVIEDLNARDFGPMTIKDTFAFNTIVSRAEAIGKDVIRPRYDKALSIPPAKVLEIEAALKVLAKAGARIEVTWPSLEDASKGLRQYRALLELQDDLANLETSHINVGGTIYAAVFSAGLACLDDDNWCKDPGGALHGKKGKARDAVFALINPLIDSERGVVASINAALAAERPWRDIASGIPGLGQRATDGIVESVDGWWKERDRTCWDKDFRDEEIGARELLAVPGLEGILAGADYVIAW